MADKSRRYWPTSAATPVKRSGRWGWPRTPDSRAVAFNRLSVTLCPGMQRPG
jgi:hypothetical protein